MMKRIPLLVVAALLLVRCAPAKPSPTQLQAARQANRLGVARMLWFEQGYQYAIASFEEALKAYPNYFEARYNLGLARFERGNEKDKHDFTDALTELDRAARLRPDSAAVHFTRGLVLIKLNRLDEALAALKKALAADPDDPDTNYWVGGVLADQDKHAEALPFLQRAVELRPARPSANYRLAMSLQILGRADEAKAAFDRHNQLRTHPGLYPKIIEWYGEQGKYARALEEPFTESPAPAPESLSLSFKNAEDHGWPKGSIPVEGTEGEATFAVGDINGDGALDVVITAGRVWVAFNDGKAHFSEVSDKIGLARVRGAWGALLGDLNNDGRLDLFLRGVGLFLQDEKGVFRKAKLPVKPDADHVMFVDLDHDGDLEIVLSRGTGIMMKPIREQRQAYMDYLASLVVHVLRNLGNGVFREATAEFGLEHIYNVTTACAADLNGDRLTDLIFGGPTGMHFFYNDWSGKFVKGEVRDALAALQPMSMAAADVTGDGRMDILAADPEGTWQCVNDAGHFAPKQLSSVGGALAVADFDNDGWPDIVTLYEGHRLHLRNHGLGDFDEIPDNSGLTNAGEYPPNMIVADFDRNGFPDVYHGGVLEEHGKTVLRTQLELNQGNANHWVRLQLEGQGDSASNRQAVGTRVEVVAGPIARAVEVQCTESAAATPSGPVLVGIGAQPEVDYVRLSWTSGTHAAALPAARSETQARPAQQVEFGPAGEIPSRPRTASMSPSSAPARRRASPNWTAKNRPARCSSPGTARATASSPTSKATT